MYPLYNIATVKPMWSDL